jgi:adenylate cyclase
MEKLGKHGARILVTLLPLVFALLHATQWVPIGILSRLDDIIYDARLRAMMPKTQEDRIVIVDLDERSLAEFGRWPWSRDKMAKFVAELFDRQAAAVVGFDVVFAEPDESSGLKRMQQLAANELRDQSGFVQKLNELAPLLDNDALFAAALKGKPAVLGYYLTSDRDGRKAGVLPKPVMTKDALQGRRVKFTQWDGYGSNLQILSNAAPMAGYFNSINGPDGVVRSIPLIAEHEGKYYESLSLAMFRLILGLPQVEPAFPTEKFLAKYQGLESVRLRQGTGTLALDVDENVSLYVPFRGPGGPSGGSFRYISAADVLKGKLAAGSLKEKLVLVGTSAPGLLDMRVTPVGEVYPGVEVHANVLSGLLDGRFIIKPDYALGFEVLVLLVLGLILAFALPLLSAPRAVLLSVAALAAALGLNLYLYASASIAMPLATTIVTVLAAFALNMSYGYFVESRNKRELANLFKGYVPPELVDEMVDDPESYSMKAANKELTVMFCDMRGFTNLSEKMEPTELQALLNNLFSRLTNVIRTNRGTTDKYMGDCVMAFWGAPIDTPEHAQLAVRASLEMSQAVRDVNAEHRAKGLPEIGVGIGLNTGTMCVGDMGSEIRRSYTVIGDAVNLGSRLEGLSKFYGVDIVVSDSTRKGAKDVVWQELDRVKVKGKEQAVAIYWPAAPAAQSNQRLSDELRMWQSFLKSYRAQDWDQCDVTMLNLMRMNEKKYLYKLYADRVNSMKMLPFDPGWDGSTQFDSK